MEKLEKKRHKKNYRILPFCAPLRRMQDDFFSVGGTIRQNFEN